ncbi:MAG: CHAT domain-containing protein [Alphaproteobacteria bacterium]|nr:CHAT domain-containing protein [Alphaproteobacteria bacterium]
MAGHVRKSSGRVLSAAVAVALVASCQSSYESKKSGKADTAKAEEVVSIALGKNMVGEECRAQPRQRGSVEEMDNKPFDIFCGTWEQPSGRFIMVSGERVKLLGDNPQTWASTSWWRQQIDQRLECKGQQESRVLDNVPAVIMECQLRRGGWPYTAFVARDNGSIFLADGIPPAQTALEAAIRRVVDPKAVIAQTAADGQRSQAILDLEKRLGKSGGMFSTNDLAAYQDLMRLGQLYNSSRNYIGAERAYRKALEIHERVLGFNNPETGTALISLALEVSNQGRFDEARALFDRAEPLVRASQDSSDTARYLTYRAMDAANRQDRAEAIKFAREATQFRKDLVERERLRREEAERSKGASGGIAGQAASAGLRQSSVNEADVAQSLRVEAHMLMRNGELREAEQVARNGQEIYTKSRRAPETWAADFDLLLGEIWAKQSKFAEAAPVIQGAIDMRQRLFGEAPTTAFAHMQMGELRLQANDPTAALASFRKGVAMLRAGAQGGSGVEITYERLAPYLLALLREAEAKPAEAQELFGEMFVASQLQREGVTSQTIAKTAARLAASDSKVGELVRALQEAERTRDETLGLLNVEQGKDQAQRDLPREQQLKVKQAEAEQKIQELEQQIQIAFPGYAQLVGARPITVADIAGKLRPNEALVRYVLGETASFAFLVRSDKTTVVKLGVNKRESGEMIAALRQAFEVVGGRVREFDLELSHQLYKGLMQPLEPSLAGVEHLVTVPVGDLLSLPFAILVTNPSPGLGSPAAYVRTQWLGRRYALSVVPSVRAFVDLRSISQVARAPLPFIGFGNPDYAGGAPASAPAPAPAPAQPVQRVSSLAPPLSTPGGIVTRASGNVLDEACKTGEVSTTALLRQLAPLPETADELRRIASVLKAPDDKVVLGAQATVGAVRKASLDQYRVVYFALHGLLPGELRCQVEPALALTPPAQESAKENGLLTASEIAELRLNADLVVLSACNTGGGGSSGKLGGEALSGLARSFFFAGARTLLVTHWQVPSRATVALTTGMFNRLGGDLSQGGAIGLQAAQIELMNNPENSHPVFWGAFTLVGDGGRRG